MFCRLQRRSLIIYVSFFVFIFIIILIYQVIILNGLGYTVQRPSHIVSDKMETIRGVHERLMIFYEKKNNNKFVCIKSLEEIEFDHINDNYCDCKDGTDEPGTNACANGVFYCKNQIATVNFHRSLPSSRVNDGICDCCDGSDEYDVRLRNFLDTKQGITCSRHC